MYIQTFLSAGRKTWLERENLRCKTYKRLLFKMAEEVNTILTPLETISKLQLNQRIAIIENCLSLAEQRPYN